MAQKHKIRSLEVILDTPWESSPQAVRDRIKKLFLQKLADRLDIIFSEFYGPETHLQIDQLSIDLGDLNEENLEEEVEERVETELRKILVAIKGNEGRAKNIKADLKSEINALEFYLQNGGWPWWWQPENATTLSQLIAKQLRHAPADSFAMLLRFRNQALPLRRLLLNSSENQKLALFQLFQPPKSAISAIASVLKLNLPIAKTSISSWKENAWEAIFKALISNPIAQIEWAKIFEVAIGFLSEATELVPSTIIAQLEAQNPAQFGAIRHYFQVEKSHNSDPFADVLEGFEHGFGSGAVKKRRMAALQKLPAEDLAQLLRKVGTAPTINNNWLKTLDQASLAHCISALAGNQFQASLAFQADWEQILQEFGLSPSQRSKISQQTQNWLLNYWIIHLPANFQFENLRKHFIWELSQELKQDAKVVLKSLETALGKAMARTELSIEWPPFLSSNPTDSQLQVFPRKPSVQKPISEGKFSNFHQKRDVDLQKLHELDAFLRDLIHFLQTWPKFQQNINQISEEYWISAQQFDHYQSDSIDMIVFYSSFLWNAIQKENIATETLAVLLEKASEAAISNKPFSKDWLETIVYLKNALEAGSPSNNLLQPSAQSPPFVQQFRFVKPSQAPKGENLVRLIEIGLQEKSEMPALVFLIGEWAQDESWSAELAKLPIEIRKRLLVAIKPIYGDWLDEFLENSDAKIEDPKHWELIVERVFVQQAAAQFATEQLLSNSERSLRPFDVERRQLLQNFFLDISIQPPEAEKLSQLIEFGLQQNSAMPALQFLLRKWTQDENLRRDLANLPLEMRKRFLRATTPIYGDWLLQVLDSISETKAPLKLWESIFDVLFSLRPGDNLKLKFLSAMRLSFLSAGLALPESIAQQFSLHGQKALQSLNADEASPDRILQQLSKDENGALESQIGGAASTTKNTQQLSLQEQEALNGSDSAEAATKISAKEQQEILAAKKAVQAETAHSKMGAFTQFLLHSQLPIDTDLATIQQRLRHAAETSPQEVKAFLQQLGKHDLVARRLQILLPESDFFALFKVFGSFNIPFLRKISTETAQFLKAAHPTFEKAFLTQMMALALQKTRLSNTLELLETALFSLSQKVQLPFATLLSEINEFENQNATRLPALFVFVHSLQQKLQLPISTLEKHKQQDKIDTFAAEKIEASESWGNILKGDLSLQKPAWLEKLLAGKIAARQILLQRLQQSKALRKTLLPTLTLPATQYLLDRRFPRENAFFGDFKLLLNYLQIEKPSVFSPLLVFRQLLALAVSNRKSLAENLNLLFVQIFQKDANGLTNSQALLLEIAPLFLYLGSLSMLQIALAKQSNFLAATDKVKRAVNKGPQWSETPLRESGLEFSIANAGMVLISPFMPRYFELLGLVEMGKFKGKSQQARAVFLLCYLCNATKKPAEAELVLPKLLCGLAPSTILPIQSIRLKKNEIELTESLLKAIVGHWSALGETKPATLQETFLDRAGQLSLGENDWLLTVEKHSPDLLLRTLPWGLSPVNFSWMEKPLLVQWI